MPTNFHTELTVPNQSASLRLTQACLQELSLLAQLPEADAQALVAAAQEACANVIDHAYEPGETGTLTLIGELTSTALTLAVQDTGAPLAAADVNAVSLPAGRTARVSAHGGLHLIQQAVDKAYWVNRGKQGKELRLVKNLPHLNIEQILSAEELTLHDEEAPLAPTQEYRVVRFEADHAVGISQCIYRVYGYTYVHEDCYYPDKIVHLNESGELVSVVALNAQGEVVGHYALERPKMTRVAERGIAVVSPQHRGRGLMEKMRVVLEEEAKRVGLVGVYSQAVTIHTRSQRVNEEFGSKVCGITLGGSPAALTFKRMDTETLPQRISQVLYYSPVIPLTPVVVYAPPQHQEMIARIYANLAIPVEFKPGQGLEGYGHLTVTYDTNIRVGTILVDQIGSDTPSEIRRAQADLCEIAGAEAIYLYLPLAQPETPALCDSAEASGFFFSGVGPHFAHESDALILQYLTGPLNTALLQIANAFGKEILTYVDAERSRIQTLQDQLQPQPQQNQPEAISPERNV